MAEAEVRRAIPRWLTVVLGTAGTLVALVGLHLAGSAIAPVLLALVLTVVVHPVLAGLQRRGVRRGLAVAIAVLVADGGLIALVLAITHSLGRLASTLPTYAAQWDDARNSLRDGLAAIGIGPEQVQAALRSLNLGSVIRGLTDVLAGLVGTAGDLILVLATVLFMAADAATLPARLTPGTGAPLRLGPALASFSARTRRWFAVSTIFGGIVAILDGVALAVLGVPLAFVWALLSFVTNYVPNVGFVIGLVPPALLAWLVDGPRTAILVVVLYSVINFVLQSLIQPVFVADAVDLSVSITFLSLVLWAAVLGPVGAVLSVPLTLLVRSVVLETDPTAAWARSLISHGATGPVEGRSPGPPRGRPRVRFQRVPYRRPPDAVRTVHHVASGRVASGRVASGRVASGRVASGTVGTAPSPAPPGTGPGTG